MWESVGVLISLPGSDVRNKAPTLKIKILTVLRNIVQQSVTGAQEPLSLKLH